MQDRDHNINSEGDPDLSAYGVGTVSVEVFDSQVLLNPAKEEFDLPAQLVELGNIYRRQGEMIGKEMVMGISVDIKVVDQTQWPWEVITSSASAQLAEVIAAQSARVIDRQGAMPSKSKVVFGSSDEEGCGSGDLGQTAKVRRATVRRALWPGRS